MPPEFSDQAHWYAENIEPHQAMIRSWLKSRYGELCDADDILQDALLRVFKAHKKSELKAPKAYFFAVARNLAIDRVRKKIPAYESILDHEALGLVDEADTIEEVASRNHELEILTEAIQALPERCRRAFTLSKVYGMTYNEIAREMGISFNTVSAQIAIGLSKCTQYMRRHGRD